MPNSSRIFTCGPRGFEDPRQIRFLRGEYDQGTGRLLIEPVAGMIGSKAMDSRRLLTCPQFSLRSLFRLFGLERPPTLEELEALKNRDAFELTSIWVSQIVHSSTERRLV